MIVPPFKNVRFEWLTATGEPQDGTANHDFGDIGWVSYPMPPETGTGGYEALDLALGMTVVRSTIKFSAAMPGRWVPLIAVSAEFNEPSFQAMTVRGFRGSVKEDFPPTHLALSPGVDLFRHAVRYASEFTADGGFSGESHHLSLSLTTLQQLIGQTTANHMLAGLDIESAPSIVARPIPLHVSQTLTAATMPVYTGSLRKLLCQAKVLEYLAALGQHLASADLVPADFNQRSRQRAHAIHSQLITYDGKLPTLSDLAEQYGRSVRLLNEEFSAEFGQSIYSFVVQHRLAMAHSALKQTEVSIKQLAERLGYAHVSNFTIAFKRKFGYPPGALRKTRTVGDASEVDRNE